VVAQGLEGIDRPQRVVCVTGVEPELAARDQIRGFIFDPENGALREVIEASGKGSAAGCR